MQSLSEFWNSRPAGDQLVTLAFALALLTGYVAGALAYWPGWPGRRDR